MAQSTASNVRRAGLHLCSDFRLYSDFTPPLWRGKNNPDSQLCVCECVCLCSCVHVLSTVCVLMRGPSTSSHTLFPILVVFWLVALKAFWSPWCYLGVSCDADGQGGRTTLSHTRRHASLLCRMVAAWTTGVVKRGQALCFPSVWSECVCVEAFWKQNICRELRKKNLTLLFMWFLAVTASKKTTTKNQFELCII